MLFDPAEWLAAFMQLTDMAVDFRIFIMVLGIGYFVLAWTTEKHVFPRLARWIGKGVQKIKKKPKDRKAYKLVLESMRI